jgi:hypothetical protein
MSFYRGERMMDQPVFCSRDRKCRRSVMAGGMTNELPTVYVGVDVSKSKLAVAMAGGRVREDVLSLGTLENAPASVDRLLKKLSGREAPVSECH